MSTFRDRTSYPAKAATYLHVRLVAAPADGRVCAARSLRAASRPAQLDRAKLAAMGVERPTLQRRLALVADPNIPPDAA